MTPNSVGAAISGVKIPKTVNAKSLFSKPPVVKKATKPAVSPYDQFTLPTPYNPKTIASTAQTQYQGDVDNATRLASMGQPTPAAITADYAGRGAAANQVYADLASRLAGVQNATVAQGNAGAAGLAQQNAATQQGAPNIAGAPAAPGIPTSAATAVLGAQTAAGGNYGGDLQRAAYSSGVQANQRAVDAGSVAATDAGNATARNLASLLAGIAPESTRETTMQTANQQVNASNLQTKLSIYQSNVQQEATLRSLGYKAQADQLAAQNRIDLAQIQQAGQTTRTGIQQAGASDRTATQQAGSNKRTAAQIAAANKRAAAALKAKTATGGTGGATASGKRQALTQAIKIATAEGGKKTSSPSSYTAKIQAVTSSGAANPLAQPTTVTVSPGAVKGWKPPKGFTVIQAPQVSKTASKTVDRPGGMTKYNRAVSYLKSTGYTDAEARAALKQYHP